MENVWSRMSFPVARSMESIAQEFRTTVTAIYAHNPQLDRPLPLDFTHRILHVPLPSVGWVDELSLETAKTINRELAIDMPEAPEWQRVALIQCRVTDAIQAALYRMRQEVK